MGHSEAPSARGGSLSWQRYLGIGFGGWVATTGAMWAYTNSEVHNAGATVTEPSGRVSIIMPTLNEEEYVEKTLISLAHQNVVEAFRDRFELIVVDSCSEDRTVEIAEKYADRVIMAPRGKLTARTLAIEQSTGDIVMATDADCFYPPNYTNMMLKHFQDPDVVGVSCIRLHEGGLGPLTMWYYIFHPKPVLIGSNSAFRRDAFDKIGGWDLGINQLDVRELEAEEEDRFARRLAQVGKVVFDYKISMISSARRVPGPLGSTKFKEEIKEGVRFG